MSTVADGVDVLSEPWFLSVPVVAVKLLKLLFFFLFLNYSRRLSPNPP